MPFDSSNKKYQFQKAVGQQEFQGFKPNFHKETFLTVMMCLYHGIPKLFSPSPLLILPLLKSQYLRWHKTKVRCFNFSLNRYISCTTRPGAPGYLPSLQAQGTLPTSPATPRPVPR